MYSNKENVNILTALLVAHGINTAVVCPGSRNAPIVHNLNECPNIRCYPVTDERSAGFYALGMAIQLERPVAVCVTSGTALLNLLPAVAEAYYQQVPLVVISADRPPQWIDQLDGQTLPQPDALGRFVRRAVSLPEIPMKASEKDFREACWYCNRLVNEALLELSHHGRGPVHVNVPISEPLFNFTVEGLPEERVIQRVEPRVRLDDVVNEMMDRLMKAERPMLVIGQMPPCPRDCPTLAGDMRILTNRMVVAHESLAMLKDACPLEEALRELGNDESYQPDFVIYMGGSIVSKRLKKFLRESRPNEVWMVNEQGMVADVTMNTTHILEAKPWDVLMAMIKRYKKKINVYDAWLRKSLYWDAWHTYLSSGDMEEWDILLLYSQILAVKLFEERLAKLKHPHTVFYANSTAIRLANIYRQGPTYCNRGVNGIEGTLSTACGASVVTDDLVFCVVGDLSFFYDQNALWNQNLRGNLRILLLNNGRGGIFNQLPGLEQSEARDRLVAARHDTTARGICEQNGVDYLVIRNEDCLEGLVVWLTDRKSNAPRLLEVITDPEEDARALKGFYSKYIY